MATAFALRDKWAKGETVFGIFASLPSAFACEVELGRIVVNRVQLLRRGALPRLHKGVPGRLCERRWACPELELGFHRIAREGVLRYAA